MDSIRRITHPNMRYLHLIILLLLPLAITGAEAVAAKPKPATLAAPGAKASTIVVAKPASESSLLQPKMAEAQWEKANGLTTFWEKDPFYGRIAKLDSRVEAAQSMAWEETLRKNPAAVSRPPKPIFAKPPYYSAIGGDHGVLLDSVLFEVVPGQDYRLTADVMGTAGAYVWIKGFRKHPKRDMLLDSYQTRLDATRLSPNEWRTISIGFNPTAKSPATTLMKVRLYAFWPIGVTYFANIRIEKITPEEMAELVKARENAPPIG